MPSALARSCGAVASATSRASSKVSGSAAAGILDVANRPAAAARQINFVGCCLRKRNGLAQVDLAATDGTARSRRGRMPEIMGVSSEHRVDHPGATQERSINPCRRARRSWVSKQNYACALGGTPIGTSRSPMRVSSLLNARRARGGDGERTLTSTSGGSRPAIAVQPARPMHSRPDSSLGQDGWSAGLVAVISAQSGIAAMASTPASGRSGAANADDGPTTPVRARVNSRV